jgi:hypothetical protein
VVVRVGLTFTVDRSTPSDPLHDALEALRALELEAPTTEVGEHYADLIRRALEHAGG